MADGDFGDFGTGTFGADTSFGGESFGGSNFGGGFSDASIGPDASFGSMGYGPDGIAGFNDPSGMNFGGFGDQSFGSYGTFGDAPFGDLGVNSALGYGLGGIAGFNDPTGENFGGFGTQGTESFGGLGWGQQLAQHLMSLLGNKAKSAILGPAAPLVSMMTAKNPANAFFGQMANSATGGLFGLAQAMGLIGPGSALGADTSPAGASAAASGGVGGSPNWVSSLFNLGTGLYGLNAARQLSRSGRPTASQSSAEAQLAALLGGGDITQMPGYAQGNQALMRQLASQGLLGSGNMATALADYNHSFAADQARLLSGLAQPRPGQLERELGGLQLMGQGLNRTGAGAAELFQLLNQPGG